MLASSVSPASLKRSEDFGSLEVGKFGDVVLLEAQSWEHLIYEFEPPLKAVFKGGELVSGEA